MPLEGLDRVGVEGDGARSGVGLGVVLVYLPAVHHELLGNREKPGVLADVQGAGHDPTVLLTEAARRRELGTVTSINDVLVWRLRRSAHLPAIPHDPPARDNLRTPAARAAQPAAMAEGGSPRRR